VGDSVGDWDGALVGFRVGPIVGYGVGTAEG